MDDELNEAFADCFTLAHLMESARICARGTRWKRRVQMFMADRLVNCAKLHRELHGGTYRPAPVERFRIVERGKPRDICPVNFRDRVVQRCLCDNVLVPAIKRAISPNTSSCLEGRGMTYAVEAVKGILDAAPWGGWVVRYDFKSYFASIPADGVEKTIRLLVRDERVREVVRLSVGSCDGLELGSHVSQLIATYYPDPMDRAVMGLPGCVGMHRYMDDGVAVFVDRASAVAALVEISRLAGSLGLTVNPLKTNVSPVRRPFVFCKMRFKKRAGGSTANVRKPQTRRSLRHLRAALALGIENEESVRASFLGYVNRGNADLTRLIEGCENDENIRQGVGPHLAEREGDDGV